MKRAMLLTLALVVSAVTFVVAQGTAANTSKKTARKAPSTNVSNELREMKEALQAQKEALEAQQQQIQQLKQELQTRDQAVQQRVEQAVSASPAVAQAESKADAAATQSTKLQEDVTTLRSDVSDLKQNSTSTALSLQETQTNIRSSIESPLAIHFKGITITPGGFLAGETIYRNRALGADINTPFNSLTMPGATQSNISEFFGSGRQSRVSMLGEGKLQSVKLTGYVEGDFLSAGVTSNNNESNSYSFRQRQAWGQASAGGWTVTGGQMWSLVTETRKGLDNRAEALPATIDPQYTVGFSWARQYGVRFTKNLGNKLWLGFSIENSQATITAHGNNNNFVIGSAGASGGLYNPSATYSFNPSPDYIFKVAFEPGWGHYEVFGLLSDFRDRIFPCATTATTGTCGGVKGPSATGAYNNSGAGAGAGANARGTLANKHIELGIHFLGGNGIGRYGTTGLPDTTVRPDGVLALIRSYQSLGTLEFHTPKIDVYAYAGGEYAERSWFLNGAKKPAPVGYGSPLFNNSGCFSETPPGTPTAGQFPTSSNGFVPGSLANCTADTRNIIEGTFGFWYKFYNGPKGRIQVGPQYSYVVRNTWTGTNATPHGIDNMVFTSFRYYLP